MSPRVMGPTGLYTPGPRVVGALIDIEGCPAPPVGLAGHPLIVFTTADRWDKMW